MNGKRKIATLCYLLGIIIMGLGGILYLVTPQLLPYQEAAIGASWSELTSGLQVEFLSLLKVSGGGYLCTALALSVLTLIPFRKGENWARNAIAAIGILAVAIVNYAGLTLLLNSPARPPLFLGPIEVVLLIAGWILSAEMKETKEENPSEVVEAQS